MRIDDIEETQKEIWEDCEIKTQELIKNKLKINERIDIDHCDRLSKKKNQNRLCTILCRITKFKEKQKILRNAKLLKNFHLTRFLQRHSGIEERTLPKSVTVSKAE